MAGGVAHVFQVVVLAAGPQAALGSYRAPVGPGFAAEKHILELDHAGIGEQQGRIIAGHKRTARHDPVTAAGKVVEKALAYFGAVH